MSYINLAAPFAGLISEGVSLLPGVQDKSSLEIGLSTVYSNPHTGYFFVIRVPRGEISMESLKLDNNFRLTGKTTEGDSIDDFPYMVFSIESSKARKTWFEIPDIAASYKTLTKVIKNSNTRGAKEAFTTFREIVLASPDLLDRDSKELVDWVYQIMKQTLQPIQTTKVKTQIVQTTIQSTSFPGLKDVPLYQSHQRPSPYRKTSPINPRPFRTR